MAEINLKPFHDAKLTQGEFAKLLGVSRVTVNMWVMGHHRPHKIVEGRVAKSLDLLARAVSDGSLPLSPNYRPKERIVQIKTVFAKLLTANR